MCRWNELGVYDIPAMISHVQAVTGHSKVIHMGHSMGTTSFYTMLAKKPEINERVFAHISLAPVAFMSHMRCLEVVRPIVLIINELVVSTRPTLVYKNLDEQVFSSSQVTQIEQHIHCMTLSADRMYQAGFTSEREQNVNAEFENDRTFDVDVLPR